MNFRGGLFIGMAMILVGLVKAWTHMAAESHLLVSTCLGRSIAIPLDTPIWERAHCWGCYLALFGMVWVAGLVLGRMRRGEPILIGR